MQNKNMIDGQLMPNGIYNERVLSAFKSVDRVNFVPDNYKKTAYIDEDMPIGFGRYMLEPLILAHLLQLADIKSQDKVMLIGCGLGYGVAITSHLCKNIDAIEDNPELVSKARSNLTKLGNKNIEVHAFPLLSGYDVHQPYDAIIIEGAVQYVPETILKQLSANGRIVTILSDNKVAAATSCDNVTFGIGKILKLTKTQDDIEIFYGRDASSASLSAFMIGEKFSL